ncbi:MAG TPA: VWA domain-containing protein [Pyrinomonadaceae bacterium]|nr:VWA domain-containing protein [Pyrinomonadaceae bacterium]
MKCLRGRCATFALLGILCSSLAFEVRSQSSGDRAGANFDRTFAQNFSSVSIENFSGRTEIQTWSSNRVRLIATQPAGNRSKTLESQVHLELPKADALKISVDKDVEINLLVYVPNHIILTIRGGVNEVVMKGVTSAISVETESGNIALQMPPTTDTNLSLRAIDGSISANLPLVIFGVVNSHSLDGRIGNGGTPVILRSARGSIELTPEAPGRRALSESEVSSNARVVPVALASQRNSAAVTRDEPGVGLGDNPVDVIKIDTRMVNLNIKVTDANGKLIPDLIKEDFQIFENNIEQEPVYFAPVTAPVNLVLLLDLSGSTKDRMKIMKKAAKKFIDTLNPNTRIGVAGFSRRFIVISDFTDDRKLLKDRIDDLKNSQSGTAFYDGMWSTLELFKEVKEKRRAVVVLTDGVDNSLSSDEYEPRHPFDELLSRLTQDDITIYPIYFDTEYETIVKHGGSDTHEAYVTARKQLHEISETTGGTLFKADRVEDLDAVYARVAAELHTMYTVAYYPKDKDYNGEWRQVKINVKRPQGATRTKPGYYAK